MLLVVAALHEEVAGLLSLLRRNAVRIVDGLPRPVCFSYDIDTIQRVVPTFAAFEIPVRSDILRIGVLITGVGKVASATAASTACAVYTPHLLLCIGCALDLAQGTKREKTMNTSMYKALACISTAIEHDVDCVHMPRIKVYNSDTKTKEYKKCSYGEFIHISTQRYSNGDFHNAIVPIVREYSHLHNSTFYENAAMLSGDVFLPHNKASLIPQSVRVVGTHMAQQYEAVLLDMETAAIFYAASFFKIPVAALAVILDSVADPSPVVFSKAISEISEMLCSLSMKVIENAKIVEMILKR